MASSEDHRARFSAKIGDPAEAFAIDTAVSALCTSTRAPKIRPELISAALSIGRRSLEIAGEAAWQAETQAPSPSDLDSWRQVDGAAAAAERALSKLISALDRRDPSIRGAVEAGAADLAPTIAQLWIEEMPAALDNLPHSQIDGAILLRAREVAIELCRVADSRRRSIGATRRGTPGDPIARAFLLPLAEGWTYLTGRPPSSNKDDAISPFLRFANAAWIDWKGVSRTPGFGALIGATTAEVKPLAWWLVARGPVWL